MNLTEAVAAQIMKLQRIAPSTWGAFARTVVPVAPDELAALQALPDASVLLEDDHVRAVGVLNATLNAVVDDVEAEYLAEIAKLKDRILVLESRIEHGDQ